MNLKNKILYNLSRSILEKNKKFKDIHKGEACYIFGNGASLKEMDLASFSDRISIGCNFLCIHRDFSELNIRYYTLVEPFFGYYFFKNPYNGKYQKNHLGDLFKKAISPHTEVNVFTSLSNVFSLYGKNFYYLHHFNKKEVIIENTDVSSCFSLMDGSLHAMLGLAIYLGFSKATLIGCDYLFSSRLLGHFYSKKILSSDNIPMFENPYKELLANLSKWIELDVVVSDGCSSHIFPYTEYSKWSLRPSCFRENQDLVSEPYLNILRKAYQKGQFTNPI